MLKEEKELLDEKFGALSTKVEMLNKSHQDGIEEIKALMEQQIKYIDKSQVELKNMLNTHENDIRFLRDTNMKYPAYKLEKRISSLEDATGVYTFFASHKVISTIILILILIAPVQELVKILINLL